jgi:hypothetical protein
MRWDLIFFLLRVSNAGASLVLGNSHHPKIFQLCTSLIRMNKCGCKSTLQLVLRLLVTNNSVATRAQMTNDSVATLVLQLHATGNMS